ncbi:MAG TPA: hypothetical protein VMI75_11900 [Polyangiaceae bacterium]|nr:hypothetical protein [Polyangiaceae bacterium]
MKAIQWLGAAAFFGTMILACGGTGEGGGTGESTVKESEDLTCGVNCQCQSNYQRCLEAADNASSECLCKNVYATCHVPHLALQVCPCAPNEGDCWLNGL